MKRRLPQLLGQMSIMQAFMHKDDSSMSNGQSIQEESSNQSKQKRPDTNSSDSFEKSHFTDIPEIACGTSHTPDVSNVVSASPAPFCESPHFFYIYIHKDF